MKPSRGQLSFPTLSLPLRLYVLASAVFHFTFSSQNPLLLPLFQFKLAASEGESEIVDQTFDQEFRYINCAPCPCNTHVKIIWNSLFGCHASLPRFIRPVCTRSAIGLALARGWGKRVVVSGECRIIHNRPLFREAR